MKKKRDQENPAPQPQPPIVQEPQEQPPPPIVQEPKEQVFQEEAMLEDLEVGLNDLWVTFLSRPFALPFPWASQLINYCHSMHEVCVGEGRIGDTDGVLGAGRGDCDADIIIGLSCPL